MPPRPSRATIRYRAAKTTPDENPPLCGGCTATTDPSAVALRSSVGVLEIEMARPQEGHKREFSEHTAPQPEQVIMLADCIPLRHEVVKHYLSESPRQLDNCRSS